MAKYFEANFMKGSFADQTGQRTYTLTGSPSLVKKEIGLSSLTGYNKYIKYSSQILPDNAFTIVAYFKRNGKRPLNQGYGGESILSNDIQTVGFYAIDAGYNNPRLALGINNFQTWTVPFDFSWHCIIATCPGTAQTDIASAKLYLDNVLRTAGVTTQSGAQTSRSVVNIAGMTYYSDACNHSLAYVATYDHVFTEQERNIAYQNFLNSFPQERSQVDYQANKPTDLSREVKNTLGTELVTNGGFDDSTGWSLGTGWSITNGVASHDNSAGTNYLTRTLSVTTNKVYQFTYTVTNYISGSIYIKPGAGGTNSTVRTAVGTYSEIITWNGADSVLYFTSSAANVFVGSIDNISIKELTGLVAAYNFVPQGSVLPDISGNGNTGTISKCVSTKEGLQFNGKNSSIAITGNNGLSGDVTFCARIYPKASTGGRIFDNIYTVLYATDSTLAFFRDGGGSIRTVSIPSVKYIDVTITSTSTGVTNFYVDGVLTGSANVAAGTPTASTAWYIGNRAAGDRMYNGTIQDLRIYNRILSLQEIKDYHNNFAKRVTFTEDFSKEGADGLAKVPAGWSKLSGSFKIDEVRPLTNTELVVNGGFDSVTGWTLYGNGAISNGTASITFDGTTNNQVQSSVALTVGKTYRVAFTIVSNTSVGGGAWYMNAFLNADSTKTPQTVGTYVLTLVCTSGVSMNFRSYSGGSGSIVFDNVSVREITLPTLAQGSKYLECITTGGLAIPSKQVYGTWEWDFYKGGDTNEVGAYFINLSTAGYITTKGAYWINFNSAEAFRLHKGAVNAVTILNSSVNSYMTNNTWYRVKITRSISGVFTVYIKGGAFGNTTWTQMSVSGGSGTNPVTDTTYTTSEYFLPFFGPGDRITNIKMTDGIEL